MPPYLYQSFAGYAPAFPNLSLLPHMLGAHMPMPFLVGYSILTTLSSFIPSLLGLVAVAWILTYQILSLLGKTRHPSMPPIPLIKGCVSSFFGVYLLSLFVMIPIQIKTQMTLQQKSTERLLARTTAIQHNKTPTPAPAKKPDTQTPEQNTQNLQTKTSPDTAPSQDQTPHPLPDAAQKKSDSTTKSYLKSLMNHIPQTD